MSDDARTTLQSYLGTAREALVWKLDGLGEYDIRRPVTPTGTNLLGLVKHMTMAEAWFLGQAFERPFPEPLPWWDEDAEEGADMWATEEESRAEIVRRYQRACAHADVTITQLGLDAIGDVAGWPRPRVTLHAMVVHVLSETCRHAGQADIIREHLDGAAGSAATFPQLADRDVAQWDRYRARIETAARAFVAE